MNQIIKLFISITAFTLIVICIFNLSINSMVISSTQDRIIKKDHKPNKQVDCIIVLGAGVRENGELSDMLRDRILTGIDLYKHGYSKKLIMSGDHGRKSYDEVNPMKGFAIEKGIQSRDIFMDHAGFSTYESIYRAKHIFKVKSTIIVTQKYHLYRALYIAKSLGIDAYGVEADLQRYYGQTYRDFREVMARSKDVIGLMLNTKPKYLGASIPVCGNGDSTNDKK